MTDLSKLPWESLVPLPLPEPIVPAKHGDEWLHHLNAEIGKRATVTGSSRSTASEPFPHIVVRPTTDDLRCHLWLVLQPSGLIVLLAGTDADIEREADTWRAAVAAASRAMASPAAQFRWAAAVAPAPDQYAETRTIDASIALSPLLIRPSQHPIYELVPSVPPQVGTRRSHFEWPLIVEGRHSGYDWWVAAEQAREDIHRLCALLAIAWPRPWITIYGPHPMDEPGQFEFIAPQADGPDDPGTFPAPTVERPPEWFADGWRLLESDTALRSAAESHLEGMLLAESHPSMALIAFVASIEAIGAQKFPVSHCPECNQIRGSTKRFRDALALVRPPEEAKFLAEAYGPRSRTAHAGVLHADEGRLGFSSPRAFSHDPTFEFRWRLLYRLQQAATDLLRHSINEAIANPAV